MVGWRNKKSGKFFTIAMKTFSIIQTYIKLLPLSDGGGEAGESALTVVALVVAVKWSDWYIEKVNFTTFKRRFLLCRVVLPTSSPSSPNTKMTLNIHSHFHSVKSEEEIHKYYNVKNDEKDTTKQPNSRKVSNQRNKFRYFGTGMK